MNRLMSDMIKRADPSQVSGLSRFFKTGPGQYGEGDKFLGIKVPVTREVVKACWRDTSMEDIRECIESEYHELRLAALLTLVQIFHSKKAQRQECVDFYLAHTARREQRIGIVSTMTFIRHGQLDDTFAIADILLHHPHDLIQKAVGWLLREAGKRDKEALTSFLAGRSAGMPRTMLRYAIEKFPEEERKKYLKI